MGYYDLTIDASQITGAGGNLDGDANSTSGGNYSVIGSTANKFFRLYGDGNGDGTVNQPDYIAFRNAFNNGPSSAFDFEGDGNVTQSDYIQFRNRFNLTP